MIWVKVHMRQGAYAILMQKLLDALSDPTRRAALSIVWEDGEHCVCELMERLDASQSRMSRHMKILREAGLVLDRRDAQWVRFRRNPDIAPAAAAVVSSVLNAEKCWSRSCHDNPDLRERPEA
nr:metalloregulator ArsR/SmtB family transcription factor [Marinicella sp. W31]MDC2876268.1 metalloregulator ArsR/SmtB family transcription factor [Marinicella sp. W31]